MAKTKTENSTEEKTTSAKNFTAKCICGAKQTADTKAGAVTRLIHKDGCRNDLTRWQDFITVE